MHDDRDVDPLPWEQDADAFQAADEDAAERLVPEWERRLADEEPAEAYTPGPAHGCTVDCDHPYPPCPPAEPGAEVLRLDDLERFLAVRDPRLIAEGSAGLRETLLERVREIVGGALETLPEAPQHSTDVRPAATRIGDLAELLGSVADAFTAAAKEAKGAAADVVVALGHPVRVGDGYGTNLRISLDQRKELSVDDDAVDDVLVAAVPYVTAGPRAESLDYALGVRAGLVALRKILSASPGYRSTALDALVAQLEDADIPEALELAKRLRKAYGRVNKGEPTVKLERVEAKRARS